MFSRLSSIQTEISYKIFSRLSSIKTEISYDITPDYEDYFDGFLIIENNIEIEMQDFHAKKKEEEENIVDGFLIIKDNKEIKTQQFNTDEEDDKDDEEWIII